MKTIMDHSCIFLSPFIDKTDKRQQRQKEDQKEAERMVTRDRGYSVVG